MLEPLKTLTNIHDDHRVNGTLNAALSKMSGDEPGSLIGQTVDDRTEAQQSELTTLIGGKDTCLSGWGKANMGYSYAYWACHPDDAPVVRAWVASRRDIVDITVTSSLDAVDIPSNSAIHIYAVTPNHPARRTDEE